MCATRQGRPRAVQNCSTCAVSNTGSPSTPDRPYRPGQATLIYRARNAAEIAFRNELEWFAARRGVRVVYVLGRRAQRESWLPAQYADHPDAAALAEIAPLVARSDVYICGPEAWAEAARAAARSAGTPAERVHTELFSW